MSLTALSEQPQNVSAVPVNIFVLLCKGHKCLEVGLHHRSFSADVFHHTQDGPTSWVHGRECMYMLPKHGGKPKSTPMI